MLDTFGPESDPIWAHFWAQYYCCQCVPVSNTRRGPIEASPYPARDERTTDSQARNRDVRDALAA